MPDLSLIENLCGIFKAKLEMSEPYSENLEYLQATVEACREMISPETLEKLIQSILYQSKSVINAKGYFPLKENLSNSSRCLVIDHCTRCHYL
jgi:hypothetical protein